MKEIRVASKSEPKLLATFIAETMREEERINLNALGAAAVNQAVKAIAIARSYTIYYNFDLVCVPGFNTEPVNGEKKTIMVLTVSKKKL